MKAADQGNATAQFNLGWCYAHGEGVTKDQEEAEEWYTKAAKRGSPEAKKQLELLDSQ